MSSNNILNFEYLKNTSSLIDLFNLFEKKIRYGLNCIKVGLISEYNPVTHVAKVNLVNKILLSQSSDGTRNSQEYPPIYCKVWFFGWKGIGITHPVLEGQECVVLISDRELESWYLRGGVNELKYTRNHDLSDGIAVVGLSSVNNAIENMQDALHLFYNVYDEGNQLVSSKDIQINKDGLIINGDITHNGNMTINGNLQVNGTINATVDVIANGISLVNHTHPYDWTDGGGSGSTQPPQ